MREKRFHVNRMMPPSEGADVETASMRDVAALAGVSIATVSNAINKPSMVRDTTIQRVLSAMDELGFVRNAAASQLKLGRSNTIGLLLADIANPFYTELARAVEAGAEQHGLTVLLGDSNESSQRESVLLDQFEQQRVRGVLIAPVGDIPDRLERLRRRGVPTVLFDRQGGKGFSSVALDDMVGGRLPVEHLIGIGRTRLAFAGDLPSMAQARARARAATRAAAKAGMQLRLLTTSAHTFEEGERLGRELLAEPRRTLPDGIFAANDLVALGLMKVLAQAGIRIPDQVAIIGYDDIMLARHSLLPLSSVQQPSARLGEIALGMLVAEISGDPPPKPRQVLLKPKLMLRESAMPA
jgi:LacI family transcriptional regulator